MAFFIFYLREKKAKIFKLFFFNFFFLSFFSKFQISKQLSVQKKTNLFFSLFFSFSFHLKERNKNFFFLSFFWSVCKLNLSFKSFAKLTCAAKNKLVKTKTKQINRTTKQQTKHKKATNRNSNLKSTESFLFEG